jgi:MFS family permease
VLLLRNKAFRFFWLARTISFAGTGITTVVLPVLIYQMTRSPAWVAAVSAIQAVPYLALGLLAGAVADRLDRKKIMVACDLTAAVLLAAVPVMTMAHLLDLGQLVVVAVSVAAVYVWFDAARFGALSVLVERSALPAASSLINSSGTVALLVAPTIGAALLAVMRPPYALGFDAASYLVSAALLASIRRPFGHPRAGQGVGGRLRADVAEGLKFLWGNRVIRTLTLSVFCTCLCWGGTFGLLVVYASRALHLAHVDVRLGLLYSVGELGGLTAAITLPLLIGRLAVGRLVVAFMAADVATLVLLAAAPSYGWALLAFFGYELAYVMVITAGVTIRQMLTPEHLQARVNTAGRMIAYGGNPVGALLAGVLVTLLPVRVAFGLLAISGIVGTVLVARARLDMRAPAMIPISGSPEADSPAEA